MNLHLQFGHGMISHSEHLVEHWGDATVILSPRDLTHDQLVTTSKKIRKIKSGAVLLDPQLYTPHADHHNLVSHSYWPTNYQTGIFLAGSGPQDLIKELAKLNKELGSSELIVPGFQASTIDSNWIGSQQAFIDAAKQIVTDRPLRATLALSWQVLSDEAQIGVLLEAIEDWGIDRYYVVPEHPPTQYIIDDASWLANLLDLTAGLKLAGKNCLSGYANHQFLLLGACKADTIASGTWLNVRSFMMDKFDEGDGSIKRKATWLYSPHLLSEFKTQSLDVAKRLGALNQIKPRGAFLTPYVQPAFATTAAPSTLLDEPKIFRHYLTCLSTQAKAVVKPTFDETLAYCRQILTDAESGLRLLASKRIVDQPRDFSVGINASFQALDILEASRGAILRRRWSSI